MPHGFRIGFNNGPELVFDDVYFPHWHFENTATTLEEEGYEAILPDEEIETDGGQPTAYCWFHEGSPNSNGKQPIIDDLGGGTPYYFFGTQEDAAAFMKEYAKQYGVTDLEDYELVEVGLQRREDAEQVLGFSTDDITELEEEAIEDTAAYSSQSTQRNISDY